MNMENEKTIWTVELIRNREVRSGAEWDAMNKAIEALKNKELRLCFTCANNVDGGCETRNVISCGNYERKETGLTKQTGISGRGIEAAKKGYFQRIIDEETLTTFYEIYDEDGNHIASCVCEEEFQED